jgi:hypothetical protein
MMFAEGLEKDDRFPANFRAAFRGPVTGTTIVALLGIMSATAK